MATALKPVLRREDLKPGESLCNHCTAKCCRYYALEIEAPEERGDTDFIRWYMLHDRTCVFTEDDTWYLLVFTECQHLQADYRCGIYHTRPQICRDYSTDNCEYDDRYVYDRYFETADQLVEYTDAMWPSDDPAEFRSPRPALLPIIG
ncbi:MAG TPA: YkgJ family cysteine cluster protein [Pirellulales bacterium]|jgi:Fe-S-cluster containining protein|nr:YkgJ family cysteine cluster protein [Pirellulales bacterium]